MLVKETIVVHESQVPKLLGAKGKTITNIDEVIVRSWQVGTLIGSKGETIADIQERTGARISVVPAPEGEVRTAIICGDTAEVVKAAKAMVRETVSWAVRPSKAQVAKADLGEGGLSRGQGNRSTMRLSLCPKR